MPLTQTHWDDDGDDGDDEGGEGDDDGDDNNEDNQHTVIFFSLFWEISQYDLSKSLAFSKHCLYPPVLFCYFSSKFKIILITSANQANSKG